MTGDAGFDAATVAARAARAATRIRDLVRETPLDFSPRFSAASGARVWFKRENLQHTGSFKLRGAANRLLTLPDDVALRGCVTASSGNHGAAVASVMQSLGIRGPIFVPETTSTTKVEAIRALGGDVRFEGTDGLDTEQHARAYAAEHDMFYVSPYNDEEVVAGQGSCGIEIVRQLPDFDAVFVAVGGGGLIGGIGSVVKSHDPAVRVIGCQPERSPVMACSAEAGRIVEFESGPTLSDGTAGGIEPGAITFPLCQEVVDEYRLVGEDEMAAAMRDFIDSEHQLLEGAAGVALAAFRQVAAEWRDRDVVILICGANISREDLRRIL